MIAMERIVGCEDRKGEGRAFAGKVIRVRVCGTCMEGKAHEMTVDGQLR